MGKILAVRNHPDRHDVSLTTRWSSKTSTDFELETERARLTRGSVSPRNLEQSFAKQLSLRGGEAKRHEEHGLEASNRMSR